MKIIKEEMEKVPVHEANRLKADYIEYILNESICRHYIWACKLINQQVGTSSKSFESTSKGTIKHTEYDLCIRFNNFENIDSCIKDAEHLTEIYFRLLEKEIGGRYFIMRVVPTYRVDHIHQNLYLRSRLGICPSSWDKDKDKIKTRSRK